MSTEFISSSIIDNFIKVMVIATQYSTHNSSGIEKLSGSLRYFTGCEFAFFNGIFNQIDSSETELIDDLEKSLEFFKAKQTPFIWWWLQQSELPAKIKSTLDANDFQFIGDFLGIAAPISEIKYSDLGEQIEIGEVSSDKELELFVSLICTVFQMSDSMKADLMSMCSSYGPGGKFRHYIGYYAGEPVASLSSYIDGKVLGLYNGATLANFQKHGLCTSLANFAIKEAESLGCEYVISQLMATAMAKGIGEKLGFKTHCRLMPYLNDPREVLK